MKLQLLQKNTYLLLFTFNIYVYFIFSTVLYDNVIYINKMLWKIFYSVVFES